MCLAFRTPNVPFLTYHVHFTLTAVPHSSYLCGEVANKCVFNNRCTDFSLRPYTVGEKLYHGTPPWINLFWTTDFSAPTWAPIPNMLLSKRSRCDLLVQALLWTYSAIILTKNCVFCRVPTARYRGYLFSVNIDFCGVCDSSATIPHTCVSLWQFRSYREFL